jgi:hypothetical protein
MPDRFAELRHRPRAKPVPARRRLAAPRRRAARAALLAAVRTGILLAGTLLAACSSSSDSGFSFFADPGKYDFYSCDQIAVQLKTWSTRSQELQSLMDRAGQSTGGAAVGFVAYKADYLVAKEEVEMLQSTARSKNCAQDPAWRSNTAIR